MVRNIGRAMSKEVRVAKMGRDWEQKGLRVETKVDLPPCFGRRAITAIKIHFSPPTLSFVRTSLHLCLKRVRSWVFLFESTKVIPFLILKLRPFSYKRMRRFAMTPHYLQSNRPVQQSPHSSAHRCSHQPIYPHPTTPHHHEWSIQRLR